MQTIGIHRLVVERRKDETNIYSLSLDDHGLRPFMRMPKGRENQSAEELSDFVADYYVVKGNSEPLSEGLERWRTSTQTDDAGLVIRICITEDIFGKRPCDDWHPYTTNDKIFTYEFDRDGLKKIHEVIPSRW